MFRVLLDKFWEMMLDEDRQSFGKSVSLPFLLTAWAVGTIYGGQLLWNREDPTDLIWTMASVAMLIYAAYKGGKILVRRGQSGKVTTEKDSEELPS